MKVIDLLNKIANGEEVPEEIKYKGTSYEYKEGIDYRNLSGDYLLSTECVSKEFLNSEVEIIEEDKEIEEINIWYEFDGKNNDEIIYHMCTELKDKINELIKAVNELNRKED